ncbi:MAG: LysR family transcriptional regulator [Pseudomonadota bacterium]
MDETKVDWDDLRLFLAVARGGGLAAAAGATGKSAPTLGRRMLALERRLGRELFRRLPRGYALTEEGEALLARTAALEAQLLPLLDTREARRWPVVKVSAGTWVTHLLCQRAAEIVRGSAIRLRFIAAEEVLDIGRREAVIGVRNQRPEDTRLAGRRVGRIRFAVFARDPGVATWARVLGPTPSARWVQDRTDAAEAIEVTHPRNALDLARAGIARVVLPTFVGDAIAGLERISAPIAALEHDQWLVTHHEDRFLPETREALTRIHAILRAAAA